MKKLNIIVDVQNDFVSGTLGFEGANQVVLNILQKLEKEQDCDLVFTRDTHGSNYLETQEGRRLPIEHCILGSNGWELDIRLKPFIKPDTIIFNKPTFASLELGNYLDKKNYDVIEVMGLVSNICVISTCVIAKAACPEARIIVDTACTDSYDPVLNQSTFDVLEGLHVDVIR
ncbi:cysteine hydrolase [Erysipelothrix rhusiopathiae]|uniref:cysteine hydrolase family protein n=1 Tax=Erysipelothrix rhusiopathiae TaxID=1648 RepID=UPI000210B7E6|nr:isochorismatase family cysteine hydrolase [Erysipelothrix rhusiopathiae]AGN24334.1 isochorismatase hydrolase [Erysipelothrix rhusiopathiae SY1027]MCG4456209.1 cysteine hydrolase [Erysipelothrix rhusiopathiae]MDE8032431.1 cysteine hydrolase [Erysipelothrix rhusiopathiae]MDE8036264.1 cysteine hydrolase [Erysipelothrix rhusiopathiae]MDE8037746.1 cysteine hydrolase [Erysipelothrix rhusiopathiae]